MENVRAYVGKVWESVGSLSRSARKEYVVYGFGWCFGSFLLHASRFGDRTAMTAALVRVSSPVAWGKLKPNGIVYCSMTLTNKI